MLIARRRGSFVSDIGHLDAASLKKLLLLRRLICRGIDKRLRTEFILRIKLRIHRAAFFLLIIRSRFGLNQKLLGLVLAVSDNARCALGAAKLFRLTRTLFTHIELLEPCKAHTVCDLLVKRLRCYPEKKRNENQQRADQYYHHAYVEPAPKKLPRKRTDDTAADVRDPAFVMLLHG